MKKIIFLLLAALMVLFTLIAATQAYTPAYYYQDYYGQASFSNIYPSYHNQYTYGQGYYQGYNPFGTNYIYYDESHLNGNVPVVSGPYPRQYLFHQDMGIEYKYDDFRGYDSFVGYKEVDVYYPSLGYVDIIRSNNYKEIDKSIIPEGMKTFGQHVHGYMPGPNGSCAMYVKHYGHEHAWEMDSYSYGYGYQYYTPLLAYQAMPQATRSCQSISACEYNYRVACNR